MPRTIVINYARLSGNPQTAFDLTTGLGAINAPYVVGTYEDVTIANPDGTTGTQTVLTERPGCGLSASTRIELTATDTAASKMQEMIGSIMQQEQLTPAAQGGTDRFYSPSGQQLA